MRSAHIAAVNGLKMYYEIHGSARPLVLIHGGGSTIQTTFGRILRDLARRHRVIAVEMQAHGHTRDIDRPLSFEQDADDVAALLEQLHIDKADFMGFSNGGTTCLQIAIRHPNRVRKLVVAAAMFKRDGLYPEFWESMRQATLQSMPKELQDAYRKVAPHPEQLPTFHDKCVKRMLEFKDWQAGEIQSIQADTLIMIGDGDTSVPSTRWRCSGCCRMLSSRCFQARIT